MGLVSCRSATSGESDLPLEEWVVTKAYVAWADGSAPPYDVHVTFSFADSSLAAGDGYADDYAGETATDPLTLCTISPGTFVAGTWGYYRLSSAPDPSTNPIITFDTNHYFYRIDNSSTFQKTVAKCHFKTTSVSVTFEQ